MSVYTYHLIEALQGANNRPGETTVKLSDLMNYLGKAVPESARKLCTAEQVRTSITMRRTDFPIALVRGGKGLPAGGWSAVKRRPILRLAGSSRPSVTGPSPSAVTSPGRVIITGDQNRSLVRDVSGAVEFAAGGRRPQERRSGIVERTWRR